MPDLLKTLDFCAAMPSHVRERLAAECSLRQIAAGTLVFREGSPAREMLLVRDGSLALEISVPGAGPVRILTVGKGEMAGWSALLGSGTMTSSAIAVVDTEVLAAPASRLVELAEADHEFGWHLMRRMAAALSQRLTATRLQLLDLFASQPLPGPPAADHRDE